MTQEEIDKIEQDIFKYGLLQFRKYDTFLISNLIENKISFGAPQNFNDPFDCNLPLNFESSLTDVQNLTIEANFQKGNFNIPSIAKKALELYNNPKLVEDQIKNLIFNCRRFSCFNLAKSSQHLHNSLFWANYANKHSGICMKFSGELIKYYHEYFHNTIGLVPVVYCTDNLIPEFNYIRNRSSRDYLAVQYFFGTKSKEWENEDEIRLVYQPDSKIIDSYINFEFAPISLESVYIGCKISTEEEKVIQKCLSDKKYGHVDIYRLEMDDKRFKLNDKLIRQGIKS
jgi:hypothetical protein